MLRRALPLGALPFLFGLLALALARLFLLACLFLLALLVTLSRLAGLLLAPLLLLLFFLLLLLFLLMALLFVLLLLFGSCVGLSMALLGRRRFACFAGVVIWVVGLPVGITTWVFGSGQRRSCQLLEQGI